MVPDWIVISETVIDDAIGLSFAIVHCTLKSAAVKPLIRLIGSMLDTLKSIELVTWPARKPTVLLVLNLSVVSFENSFQVLIPDSFTYWYSIR